GGGFAVRLERHFAGRVARRQRPVACATPVQLPVQFPERNSQLVQRIIARFVDPRMLARWADKQSAEQERQRRMILPVAEQTAEEVRSAQNRAVRGRWSADNDVVAAASADMPAVD